jgi:hypothetical protein
MVPHIRLKCACCGDVHRASDSKVLSIQFVYTPMMERTFMELFDYSISRRSPGSTTVFTPVSPAKEQPFGGPDRQLQSQIIELMFAIIRNDDIRTLKVFLRLFQDGSREGVSAVVRSSARKDSAVEMFLWRTLEQPKRILSIYISDEGFKSHRLGPSR